MGPDEQGHPGKEACDVLTAGLHAGHLSRMTLNKSATENRKSSHRAGTSARSRGVRRGTPARGALSLHLQKALERMELQSPTLLPVGSGPICRSL